MKIKLIKVFTEFYLTHLIRKPVLFLKNLIFFWGGVIFFWIFSGASTVPAVPRIRTIVAGFGCLYAYNSRWFRI